MVILIWGAFILGIFFWPVSSFAWGPATHLYYGFHVLDQLAFVADGFRAVLTAQPLAFLYGCVGADIVLAKKLGSMASHGHRWDNAIKLLDEAPTEITKSFSLGYLCHLAADTVSHNSYVPFKTVESFQSGVLKHLYWEMRFDQKLTSARTLETFSRIAETDFADCDAHMEKIIPVRIFNFSTNRKVFNRLLILQTLGQWQTMLGAMGKSEVHHLNDREVEEFIQRSLTAIFKFFKNDRHSETCLYDPIGQVRLRQANELRRHYWIQKNFHREETLHLASTVSESFKRSIDEKIDIEAYKIKL